MKFKENMENLNTVDVYDHVVPISRDESLRIYRFVNYIEIVSRRRHYKVWDLYDILTQGTWKYPK